MAAYDLPVVTGASGHHFELEDGRKIFDACGGAAVACIGYGHESVSKAISEQALRVPYVPWAFFDNVVAKDLREFLLKTTDNHMKDCYIMSSGSEAVEAAAKLAREFHTVTSSPQRTKYIARNTSYHGCTLGALALSGYESRRAPYEPLLSAETERLPAFNPYRQMEDGETAEVFVRRKLAELDDTFIRAGPETIAAVIMEPVVGAAMGCVPGWPGYLHGVRAMCRKYGALLIFDEVMCGMGRTGTMHAWQNPELVGDTPVVPDLQTIGKGLAGGYAPASALLVGEKIFEGMRGRVFTHGHTYQDHPVVCAAARAVQRVVEEENLLTNVRSLGPLLGSLLKENLGNSPYIGDIRGVGMFWGIEIVQNKVGKTPFERNKAISKKIHQLAISDQHNLMIYHGQGCAGSSIGDHLMICPAYNVSEEQIRWIADTVAKVIHTFFEMVEKSKCSDGSRQDINIVNQ